MGTGAGSLFNLYTATVFQRTGSAPIGPIWLDTDRAWDSVGLRSQFSLTRASLKRHVTMRRGHSCRFHPPEQLPIVFSGAWKQAEDLPWTCFKPRKCQH